MSGRALFVLVSLAAAASLFAQPEPDRARTAKALFFDHRYAEARQAWQDVLSHSRGPEATTAAFWIARSSENLGENERALREYGEFLARRPADKALAEEARTNRVGLAARLYKAGQRQHLDLLQQALRDESKTVRYYAALQLAGLGPEAGRPAIPVLTGIVATERDQDLVQRAKLALLRLDPQALSAVTARPRPESSPAGETRMLKVRIFDKARGKPSVSINLPLALAEVLFKSLPEDAKRELRRKGYDADTFWAQLQKMGPSQIIEIEGDDKDRIQIWIE